MWISEGQYNKIKILKKSWQESNKINFEKLIKIFLTLTRKIEKPPKN